MTSTEKVNDFKEPFFGEGPMGTVHGERSDADGHKFFRITFLGPLKIKVVKGCTLKFESKSGTIECTSDTKDIESIYSAKLGKGITTFEIYLDKELHQSLKAPINSVEITFPKKFLGNHVCSFKVRSKMFSKLIR